MRHLVRDNFVDNLLGLRRGVFRIKQKRGLVISDSTPVFHRAAETAGQSDLVEFRQGIGHAEIIVVVLQDLRRRFERVSAQFRFAFRCDDTNLRRTAPRFDEIELASNEHIQITRHRRGRGKAHLFSASDFFLALNRHVRDGDPISRNDGRQLKARAKGRFVPTREKSASVSCFELRPEHEFFFGSCRTPLLLITHVKKALPLLIDFARKTKRKPVISGRDFRRQCEDEQFVFTVDLNRRLRQHFAIQRRLADFHLQRIEHQPMNRVAHVELYRFCSTEL